MSVYDIKYLYKYINSLSNIIDYLDIKGGAIYVNNEKVILQKGTHKIKIFLDQPLVNVVTKISKEFLNILKEEN